MLKIIAASSLVNSIEELQISLRKQLRELVHAGPGFSLGYQSLGLIPFGLHFSSSHLALKFQAKWTQN